MNLAAGMLGDVEMVAQSESGCKTVDRNAQRRLLLVDGYVISDRTHWQKPITGADSICRYEVPSCHPLLLQLQQVNVLFVSASTLESGKPVSMGSDVWARQGCRHSCRLASFPKGYSLSMPLAAAVRQALLTFTHALCTVLYCTTFEVGQHKKASL